jgi:hypothetical protein
MSAIDPHQEDADLTALAFLFHEILHYPQAIKDSSRLNVLFVQAFVSPGFIIWPSLRQRTHYFLVA